MSISVSEDLFEKLRGKFPNLALGRDDGVKTLQPQEAKFFEFQYKNKDAIMGSVVVSLVDEGALKVYFNERMLDEADQETHDGWYTMLKGLSKFATQHMLNFETTNITKHRLNKNDYEYLKNRNKSQEELTMENKLYGTSNKSYQDVNGAKLIVQHNTSVDEEKMGARSRNIRAIYIENAQGERFRFSNNYLPGARAMARHVGNGGYPNDPFGEHIEEVMTEMNELRQFVRTVRATKYINEEAQDIIETATGRYHGLKDTLKSLTSQRGYVNYFENYEPTDVEIDEESIGALKEKLTREVYDERLDSVLPTVGRAIKRRDNKQLAEDDELKAIGMSSEPLKIYPSPEKDAEMDVYLKFIKRSDLSQDRKNKALLVNITRMLSDRIVDDAASVALSRLDLDDKSDMALAYKLAIKFIRGEVDVIEPKAKKDLYGKDHVAKEDAFEEFEAQLDDITATVDESKMSDIDIEMHEEVLYMAEDDFVEKYSKYASEDHVRGFWKSAHDEFTEPMEGSEDFESAEIAEFKKSDEKEAEKDSKKIQRTGTYAKRRAVGEEEAVKEGTWEYPESDDEIAELKELLKQPIPLGPEGANATDVLGKYFGDDDLFDALYAQAQDMGEDADANLIFKKWMEDRIKDDDYGLGSETQRIHDMLYNDVEESHDSMSQQPISTMNHNEIDDIKHLAGL